MSALQQRLEALEEAAREAQRWARYNEPQGWRACEVLDELLVEPVPTPPSAAPWRRSTSP